MSSGVEIVYGHEVLTATSTEAADVVARGLAEVVEPTRGPFGVTTVLLTELEAAGLTALAATLGRSERETIHAAVVLGLGAGGLSSFEEGEVAVTALLTEAEYDELAAAATVLEHTVGETARAAAVVGIAALGG